MNLYTTERLAKKEKPHSRENRDEPRKFYQKPHLEKLGNLHTLTLGTSPGAGDSSNPAIFKV